MSKRGSGGKNDKVRDSNLRSESQTMMTAIRGDYSNHRGHSEHYVLSDILAGEELHLEEIVPVDAGTKILYDPSIYEKVMNMFHVDFNYVGASTFDMDILASSWILSSK